MALIKCPECGKEFSDKAAACPNCAFPMTEILKLASEDATNANESAGVEESDDMKKVLGIIDEDNMALNDERIDIFREEQTKSMDPLAEGKTGTLKYGESGTLNNEALISYRNPDSVNIDNGISNKSADNGVYHTALPQSRSRKKSIIIGVIIGVLAIIGLVSFFIIKGASTRKKESYEKAIKAFSRGDYEKAIDDFEQLGNYKDAKRYLSVCEAKELCSAGKYEDAYDELKNISGFDEAKTLLRQIYYEGRFFEGITDMRSYYKNPDSLQINSVDVYLQNDKLVFLTTSSGQNGFGGYSTSHDIFTEGKNNVYQYLGSCNSMDEDDYSTKDEDDLYELLILKTIEVVRDEGIKVEGSMDFERVKNLIQNGNYTSITRVKELTLDIISEE
ncbi:hypothetical protein SAMN04487934_11425 [Eubacterium ruminantium]|nr:hypothetical protein SAMN04487934_11425 [Eubacterium ruminantium]